MKRHGHLFPTLCSFSHLLAAFRRAQKGSGRNLDAQRFFFELEPRLLALQRDLLTCTYQPAPYRYFYIHDPKFRQISVAPFVDRVVHHALVGVLEPIFERTFIHDSYATRKEKGSHAALLRAQQFVGAYRWFYKTDVDQFFASIDQEILLKLIARKIKDPQVMDLAAKIIRNGGEAGKGLPIGNLTSQFFANVYLNPLDHFIKEHLRVKAYLRYMDDFVLFAHDRSSLKAQRQAICEYLSDELKLRLKPTSSFLNQRSNGLSFLGARIFPRLMRIHPVNLRRSQRRLRHAYHDWEQGKISEAQFVQSLESRWAHLSWFDSLRLRQQLVRDLPE